MGDILDEKEVMMKTWLISELFYPEETGTGYFMTQIADKIAEDTEVNVICAPFNYETEIYKANYAISERVKIHRVWMPKLNKNKLFSRIIRMLFLTLSMGFKALFKIKKGDKVILVTNPASSLVFISLIRRLISFKYIIIVHDLFPENLVPANMIREGSLTYNILKKIFDYSYNSADHLIVVGADMKERIESKIKRPINISIIQNWADSDNIYPLNSVITDSYYKIDFAGKIVIQFAGNIGRVQGLEAFFEILKEINNPNLVFVFLGEGAAKSALCETKKMHKLDQVYFFDALPRSEQCSFLNASSIGLVSLSSGMYGLGVPSKTYNIFSAGKPILFIGDSQSEISHYINENDVGWVFSWDQKKEIIDFLNSIDSSYLQGIRQKGTNARELVDKKFTKRIIIDKYKSTILAV